MGYTDLEIGGGDAAIVAFMKMVRGLCTEAEAKSLRESLLIYCKQDTRALVELHRVVSGLL